MNFSKYFLIISLLFSSLYAKNIFASYDISFAIFSKLGRAETSFKEDEGKYKIEVLAKTKGFAKFLSNGREELFISEGIVKDGQLLPLKYSKTRKNNKKSVTKTYSFDHENEVVYLERFEGEKYEKHENDFYAKNDILSLFFNSSLFLTKKENHTSYAVGGNKKDGRVDIEFPVKDDLERAKKILKMDDGIFVKVVLNEPIFSSNKGELLINLDSDGLAVKAVLEDVLLFGDIVGTKR